MIRSVEELRELAEAASQAMGEFCRLAAGISNDQADFVRRLRVDESYSWRAVARACHEAWHGTWQPPSNQIMGMALCQEVASRQNEDYMQSPWN